MPYQRLIYRSQVAAFGNPDADLARILDVSRRNNAARGITGALTQRGRSYVQVLEGPKAQVESLMEVLSRDGRHENVHVLGQWRASGRLFCGWSMANTPVIQASAETLGLIERTGLGLELVGVLFGLANSSPLGI